MSEILIAGETLIDFLPDSTGPLAGVERFARRAGGAPANVAVGLARLDVAPLFWTRVGHDPFGDFLVETLRSAGIPDEFVERDDGAKTSIAFVSHDGTGDRAFTFYRDGTADTRMEPGTIPDETLAEVTWVHIGGVTLADEPSRSATLDLARRAQTEGCTVSFDPNARPELWDDDASFAAAVEEALSIVDVVKATPEDLRAAGHEAETPEAHARTISASGAHTILLTLGSDGSFGYATEEAPWGGRARHRGYEVDPVDTTGAGDAFLAGAIAAMASGERSLEEILGFANAVAAVTTTAEGAMTALPGRDEVEEFRQRTARVDSV